MGGGDATATSLGVHGTRRASALRILALLRARMSAATSRLISVARSASLALAVCPALACRRAGAVAAMRKVSVPFHCNPAAAATHKITMLIVIGSQRLLGCQARPGAAGIRISNRAG